MLNQLLKTNQMRHRKLGPKYLEFSGPGHMYADNIKIYFHPEDWPSPGNILL